MNLMVEITAIRRKRMADVDNWLDLSKIEIVVLVHCSLFVCSGDVSNTDINNCDYWCYSDV